MTTRSARSGAAALAGLLLLSGCKKSADLDPRSLPDINAQLRPYVTTRTTAVKTGPGNEFRTIAEIKANSRVNVVGRDGDWLLIVSKKGNAPGFIEIGSVKPGTGEESEAAPPVVRGRHEVLANTQVRSGPGLHYPVVAQISKGTIINVASEENGWLRVESKRGNQPGYVEASLARPTTN
ncbi:MAG TPA: SH3 domain-containing protein [Candidatus Eisenbacteria bacterium]|nr:SH3 domain-containing protein [Candidatus Eisenbacteria bacterium]